MELLVIAATAESILSSRLLFSSFWVVLRSSVMSLHTSTIIEISLLWSNMGVNVVCIQTSPFSGANNFILNTKSVDCFVSSTLAYASFACAGISEPLSSGLVWRYSNGMPEYLENDSLNHVKSPVMSVMKMALTVAAATVERIRNSLLLSSSISVVARSSWFFCEISSCCTMSSCERSSKASRCSRSSWFFFCFLMNSNTITDSDNADIATNAIAHLMIFSSRSNSCSLICSARLRSWSNKYSISSRVASLILSKSEMAKYDCWAIWR